MKKILLILTFIVITSLTACGNEKTTQTSETTDQVNENTQTVNEETDDTTESLKTEDATDDKLTSETSLSGLEQYLLDKGLLTGERNDKSAEMIGAISGFGYKENDVELYEYDPSTKAYKDIKAGDQVSIVEMDGYSITISAVNEPFILIFDNGTQSQELIDAFNAYK